MVYSINGLRSILIMMFVILWTSSTTSTTVSSSTGNSTDRLALMAFKYGINGDSLGGGGGGGWGGGDDLVGRLCPLLPMDRRLLQ